MTSPRNIVAIIISLTVVALIYLPGLGGPFLLDDQGNLRVLSRWLEGGVRWQEVIFGNDSGPLGRPVSMATFLLNAALGGLTPFGYKVVNLAIHLVCMGLAAGFLRQLLRYDPYLKNYALIAALGIAFWWAILPIHAATVLYVVQRMAQLSALFIIGGLWLYVYARGRIDQGHRSGTWLLWLGIPAVTAIGALAKENALLLPVLCGALELGYFSKLRRSSSVRWFFGLTVFLPAGVLAALLLLSPESVLRGYASRDFGPIERVLTQSRVLWQYVSSILIPFTPRLGIFHDNYILSTGLFQPITTALAIASWVMTLTAAWFLRSRAPAVLSGLLLFLAGHLMESSIFPLEIVFLHRNYMPAIGILLAVAGLATYLLQSQPIPSVSFHRIASTFLFLIALTFCGATFGRALVWQSETSLYAQELKTNPYSIRTRTAVASLALQRGHPSAALAQVEALESFAGPEHYATIKLWQLLIKNCYSEADPTSNLMQVMKQNPPDRIHPYAAHAMGLIASRMELDKCGPLNANKLADVSLAWLANVDQSNSNKYVIGFRYNTARLLAKSGRLENALDESLLAWRDDGKKQFPIGVFVFYVAARLEDFDTCRLVLSELKRLDYRYDSRKQAAIDRFSALLRESDSTLAEPR